MMQKQKIIFILLYTIFFCCGGKIEKNDAVITTKHGEIVLELYDSLAPKHVESFKLHAQNGYYDKTIFHRVIPGFMVQGGDPYSKYAKKTMHGTGGHAAKYFGIGDKDFESTWKLPQEFSETTHERGILSMARARNPDSGGSQFFICVADAKNLDNQYTVFGKVIRGMEVVDAVVNEPRDNRDNPNSWIGMNVRVKGMRIKEFNYIEPDPNLVIPKYRGLYSGNWKGYLLNQYNEGNAQFYVNDRDATLRLKGEFEATHTGWVSERKFILDNGQECAIVELGGGRFKIVLIWQGVNVDVYF